MVGGFAGVPKAVEPKVDAVANATVEAVFPKVGTTLGAGALKAGAGAVLPNTDVGAVVVFDAVLPNADVVPPPNTLEEPKEGV